MDFKELGERLRAERERQGLTVSDIHERLKIGPSCVEAIEAGDAKNLPHVVYYKGFVKNYASFLGLEVSECLKPFEQNIPLDAEEHSEEIERVPEEFSQVTSGKKWTVASIVLGVCLLAVLGWLFTKIDFSDPEKQVAEQASSAEAQEADLQSRSDRGESAPEAQAEESPTSSPAVQQEQLSDSGEQEPGGVNTGDDASGGSKQVAKREVQETTRDPGVESQNSREETPEARGPAEQDRSSTAAEQPQAGTGVDKHTLRISATEACWLSADMDKRSKDIYLRPGESITLNFVRKLSVKLGNAGGVQLVYDGSPYDLDADSGEVLTLQLP